MKTGNGKRSIGKAAAQDLARRNARVILACRNREKANKVAQEIIESTGNKNVIVKLLDLASFSSVRKCAEDLLKNKEKLHVLINNAGIYSDKHEITEDGCEKVLQSNHFGHFLFTLLLLDLLKRSAPSRIINVSSEAYVMGKLHLNDLKAETETSMIGLYSRSKLANILFTRELAQRLENTGITVNALHPGAVQTDIVVGNKSFFATMTKIFLAVLGKSCEEGAQTTIYLAVHPAVEKTTGKYFVDCKEEKLKSKVLDKSLAKQFFIESEKIVGFTFTKP